MTTQSLMVAASLLVSGVAFAQPAMPSPPAELAAFAKPLAGKWKCAGPGMDPTGASMPITVNYTSKLDFDKWWIVDTIEVKMGKILDKSIVHTTYDAKAAKWRRISVNGMGSFTAGTSDGPKDGKLTFNLDIDGPMGAAMMREYSDITDPKAPKFWAEMSMDKGKSWMKLYEVSCKR